MMRTLKYTTALVAATLLAAACSSDRTEEENPLPQSGDQPIYWNVKEVGDTAGDTRALIGRDPDPDDPSAAIPTDPTDPNYYVPLTTACTVPPDDPYKEKGFAVGLFGDYTYKVGNKDVTVYDLYRGARLVYLPDVIIDDKVLSKWDTNVAMKYWHPEAKYIFRAYYPQRLHGYTVSTSNATTLALVYPTRKLQYDLLLGHVAVDTGKSPGQMGKAVPLEMHHALAALRFNFQLGFEDADILTSVYLLNDEERSYFSQGTVVYGSLPDPTITNPTETQIEEARKREVWEQDYNPPATEVIYKWVPPKKYWYGYDKNGDGKIEDRDENGDGKIEGDEKKEELDANAMLAEWGITKDAVDKNKMQANPILMRSASPPNSESPGTDKTETQYEVQFARAYYGKEDEETEAETDAASEGMLYCRNSGWLLVIPQKSAGTLWVCFTTKKGGDAVYKVPLPIDWEKNTRYIYNVILGRSDTELDVDIKPWNVRKHSTEIVF